MDHIDDLNGRVDELEARIAALENGGDGATEEPADPADGEEPEAPEEPDEPDGTEEPAEPAASEEPQEPTEPGTSEDWSDEVDADVVLRGDFPNGITVEEGEVALIDGQVTTPANVVVHGTLAMRPGSHLKFRDVDMNDYVGASDQHHQPPVDSDVGLWVTDEGVLDIAGTPKQGWNRTGQHETWAADDEYWISPTEPGDYEPRPWSPGDPIPRYDERVPAAEVINVTRDVVIEGPGHIHIASHQPQRIEYAQLRSMGISNPKFEGPVTGRYALHFHHGMDGTRGSVVNGVASIDAKGRVFVPHESHGITMTDIVSVNSYGEALWWDEGDSTHDLVVDGLAATGVELPEEVAGKRRDISVVVLGTNQNATIRNSAVSGSRGDRHNRSLGFSWDTKSAHAEESKAVWDFHDNVTHNNESHGLRFWFNDKWPHHVRDTTIYNNGGFGIENGAYGNSIRYSNVEVLNNASGGILHHSSSNEQSEDGGPSRYTDVRVEGPGPAIDVGRLRGTPKTRQEFIDCDLGGGEILLDDNDKTEEPFIALFRNCGDISPDDFVFGGSGIASAMEGTSIIVEPSSGSSFELVVEGGAVKVK